MVTLIVIVEVIYIIVIVAVGVKSALSKTLIIMIVTLVLNVDYSSGGVRHVYDVSNDRSRPATHM